MYIYNSIIIETCSDIPWVSFHQLHLTLVNHEFLAPLVNTEFTKKKTFGP